MLFDSISGHSEPIANLLIVLTHSVLKGDILLDTSFIRALQGLRFPSVSVWSP